MEANGANLESDVKRSARKTFAKFAHFGRMIAKKA